MPLLKGKAGGCKFVIFKTSHTETKTNNETVSTQHNISESSTSFSLFVCAIDLHCSKTIKITSMGRHTASLDSTKC